MKQKHMDTMTIQKHFFNEMFKVHVKITSNKSILRQEWKAM